MNTQTKILLAVMVIVGLAFFGDQGYRRWIEKPAQDRERLIDRLTKQIVDAEDEIVKGATASDQLLAIEERCLPSDPELAAARYQDWLLSLVEDVKLQQPSVDSGSATVVTMKDPETRKSKEAYKRYNFSLRGRGSLEQVTELLHLFYCAGHLHKIRQISLNPSAGGRLLDVNLNIEAIGLNRTTRTEKLSTAESLYYHEDQDHDYQMIARRNFFSQEGDALLSQVVLSAVTTDRKGNWEAWFATGNGQRSQVLRIGDALVIPAHEIHVLEIKPQTVLMNVDGTSVTVSLGKSIQESLAISASPGG